MLKRIASDLSASIVVFLVSLPICLGSALVAGLPVASGLVSGIVAGIVVGMISGSRLSVSGPVPGVALIAVAFIDSIGSVAGLFVAIALAGVMQIILGATKGAGIGDYFPSAVVKGVLAGIGLLVIGQQLPQVIGFNHWQSHDQPQLGIIVIGVLSLVGVFVWDRLRLANKNSTLYKFLPGGLLVVVGGLILNGIFGKFIPVLHLDQSHLIGRLFPAGGQLLDNFLILDWQALQKIMTFKASLLIAATASLLTMLNIDAADNLDKGQPPTSKNRELIGQGIANLCAGLLGGLPIISSNVRSIANKVAGNASRLSTIFHGLWLLCCLLFIPEIIAMIPSASLAALLVFVGVRMNSPRMYRQIFKLGKSQFLPFIVTALVCASVDFLSGIGLGMVVSIFFIMKSNIDSSVIFTSEDTNRYVIRIMKDVSFLNRPLLRGILDNIPDNAELVLDNARPTPLAIDRDIIELFEDFFARCQAKRIRVSFRGVNLNEEGHE